MQANPPPSTLALLGYEEGVHLPAAAAGGAPRLVSVGLDGHLLGALPTRGAAPSSVLFEPFVFSPRR
jgi:hypothetical protein